MRILEGAAILVQVLFNRQWYRGGSPKFELPNIDVSYDSKWLMGADCVILDLPSLLSANPASAVSTLRKAKPPRQVWIAFSLESAANYPPLADPAFMALFDGEFSFRQSADVWTPYVPQQFPVIDMQKRRVLGHQRCCAFISSSFNASGRIEYLKELMAHLPVASYGRALGNKRLWFDRGRSTKLSVLKRSDFTLAFENSIEEDYVTEKFFEPLLVGSVPVYLGAPNIDEFAPGNNSYINVADYPNPADLAQLLKDADIEQFHAWRRQPLRPGFLGKLARLQAPSNERMAAFIRHCVAERQGHMDNKIR